MKLNQITEGMENNTNQDLTEAPVGLFSRLLTNIGASLGLSSSEVKREVNREMLSVSRDLKSFMGGSDIKMGELTPADMKSFLDKKGYAKQADRVIKNVKKKFGSKPSAPLTKPEVDEIVLRTVAQAFKEKATFQTGKYGDKPEKTKKVKPELPTLSRAERDREREQSQRARVTPEKLADYLKNMSRTELEELKKYMGWD